MVSGHFGAPTPNLTHGFDRLWGPQYYHFNKGDKGTSMADLRRARWLFPAYLLALALFVLPIAEAGLAHLPPGAPGDT